MRSFYDVLSLSNFVILWATLWHSYYTKNLKAGTKSHKVKIS